MWPAIDMRSYLGVVYNLMSIPICPMRPILSPFWLQNYNFPQKLQNITGKNLVSSLIKGILV